MYSVPFSSYAPSLSPPTALSRYSTPGVPSSPYYVLIASRHHFSLANPFDCRSLKLVELLPALSAPPASPLHSSPLRLHRLQSSHRPTVEASLPFHRRGPLLAFPQTRFGPSYRRSSVLARHHSKRARLQQISSLFPSSHTVSSCAILPQNLPIQCHLVGRRGLARHSPHPASRPHTAPHLPSPLRVPIARRGQTPNSLLRKSRRPHIRSRRRSLKIRPVARSLNHR